MNSYVRWAGQLLRFPFYYGFEVIKSTTHVGLDTLTPGSRATPGFVEFPLRCETDFEVTIMANMISLTPGTVTVAVQLHPTKLWVHGMYVSDCPSFREELYAMEDRLLAATRPFGVPERLAPSHRGKSANKRHGEDQ